MSDSVKSRDLGDCAGMMRAFREAMAGVNPFSGLAA
jgi:hypothetical protein